MTVTTTQVEGRLREIIDELGGEMGADAVQRSSTFEELHFDSLDLAELAQIVQDEFDIELTAEDAQKLVTVGDVIDLIVARAE